MRLFKVIRDNKFYKLGTYLEGLDDEFVQPVTLVEGKAMYPYGFSYPLKVVQDFVIEVRSSGPVDRRSVEVARG